MQIANVTVSNPNTMADVGLIVVVRNELNFTNEQVAYIKHLSFKLFSTLPLYCRVLWKTLSGNCIFPLSVRHLCLLTSVELTITESSSASNLINLI